MSISNVFVPYNSKTLSCPQISLKSRFVLAPSCSTLSCAHSDYPQEIDEAAARLSGDFPHFSFRICDGDSDGNRADFKEAGFNGRTSIFAPISPNTERPGVYIIRLKYAIIWHFNCNNVNLPRISLTNCTNS